MVELDAKHKNIGATVSMINIIAKKEAEEKTTGQEDGFGTKMAKMLLGDIDKLFMAESNSCDHKHEGCCTFHQDDNVSELDDFAKVKCCIGECPLGALVDKEFKDTAKNINVTV